MSNEELWYVKLADGDVHRVTLDQLDEAFQAGHINAKTMVLASGASQWATLGSVAGLDDAPSPSPQPAPAARPAPAVAAQPAQYANARPAPSAVAQAPRYAPVPNSLRPVSMDLSDVDFDAAPFRKSSRKGWVFAVLSVAAVSGGVAVLAANRGGTAYVRGLIPGNTPNVAAAEIAAPPPVIAPPPAPAPVAPPSPPALDTPQGGASESSLNPRFNETLKQKLLDADKQRDQKAKAHQTSRNVASASPHPSPKIKSYGFTTGGNKYDPLNSSL